MFTNRGKLLRRLLTVPTVIGLVISGAAPAFAAEEAISLAPVYQDTISIDITESQVQALAFLEGVRLHRGLIGFEEYYLVTEEPTPVNVIVQFESAPAEVQVLEAELEGEYLPIAVAEAIVEAEHEDFFDDLEELLAEEGLAGEYEVAHEFRTGFNGVALTVPANLLAELAELDSVAAVFPDINIYLDPVDVELLTETLRNPAGMLEGRNFSGADQVHGLGYQGAGVVVAVLDTGVDWYHPAFAGAFQTIETAMARSENVTPEMGRAFNGNYYFFGRNYINDVAMFPTLAGAELAYNEPMETTYTMWRHAGVPRTNPDGSGRFDTSHGTHVAGTIAGRDAGAAHSVRGIAPEAYIISYRVLGPRGSGATAGIIAAMESAVLDGADVINMSLGASGINSAAGMPTTITANNLTLTNPEVAFVISAGNSGQNVGNGFEAFYTIGSPGTASLAITVANFSMAGRTGLNLDVDGNAFHIALGATRANDWFQLEPGVGVVSAVNTLTNTADGEFQVFTLPRAATSPNASPGPVPGVGNAAEFAELTARYGSEALAGNLVLVRRGYAFVEVAANAVAAGLGGVIVINNTDANDVSGIPALPLPYIFVGLSAGVEFYSLLEGGANAISFPSFTYSPHSINPTSSRGPVVDSWEISPDLGSDGTNVLSAVPAWWVDINNGHNTDYSISYVRMSGTSMSAPHVSGHVALMIDYSRANRAEQWDTQEIRVRLMNTAEEIGRNSFGVFETGAGNVNVFSAIHADATVAATYDRVATQPNVPFDNQNFASMTTGSFSFGGYDRNVAGARGINRAMTATITNEADAARTFAISYRFTEAGRRVNLNGANYANLAFSSRNVTVPAGASADFTVDLTVPASAPVGYYEGIIYVHDGENLVARLPFAGVVTARAVPATLGTVYLPRPVITGAGLGQNLTSTELDIHFTPTGGFGFNTFIYTYVPGAGLDSFLGSLPTRIAQTLPGGAAAANQPHRGTIIQNLGGLAEGDYALVLEVFRPATGGWAFDREVVLPFSVDNTAPELSITDLHDGELAVLADETVVLAGNVHDAWLETAATRGLRFDIWTNENAPAGQHHNAVFVSVGGDTPVRAEVDASGDWSLEVPAVELPAAVTVWAIDNYAPVPTVNNFVTVTTNTGVRGTQGHFVPGGLLAADPALNADLRLGRLVGNWTDATLPLFNNHAWAGLNTTELSFYLVEAELPEIPALPEPPVEELEPPVEVVPELPIEEYVPAEPTYPLWDGATVFNTGDVVTFEGRTFVAQWWTSNQTPGDPHGPWMELGALVYIGGAYAPQWTASRVFDNGDVVVYLGQVFRAQWWTRNQSPLTQWGPWQLVATL